MTSFYEKEQYIGLTKLQVQLLLDFTKSELAATAQRGCQEVNDDAVSAHIKRLDALRTLKAQLEAALEKFHD